MSPDQLAELWPRLSVRQRELVKQLRDPLSRDLFAAITLRASQPPVGEGPPRLRAGNAFDRQRKAAFERQQLGLEQRVTNRRVLLQNQRIGVMDASGVVKDEPDYGVIAEFKYSNWDAMAEHRIIPNAQKYARQTNRYMDARGVPKYVTAGVEFPQRPRSLRRTKLIEDEFAKYGLGVIWLDESSAAARARRKR